jgi:hypothetical protein
MTRPGSRFTRVSVGLGTVLVLLAYQGVAGAGHQPIPPDSEFPPTTAVPKLTLRVGDKMTVGGPLSDNFLPDTWMNVYVVPHRTWRDGDALGANAVQKERVRSNAKGQLPLTPIWKSDKVGQYDIIVDYDGDGRFSYGLDALDAIDVRAK